MIQRLVLLTLICTALFFAGEVSANKFVTISGGVASNSADKIALLKVVGFYAGLFFSAAGIGLFFGRKSLEIGLATPIVVLLLGLGLISLKFI